MSSSMLNLRKEDLSFFYYIKDVVLSDFVEFEEKNTLTFSDDLSSIDNDFDLTTNSYVYTVEFGTTPDPNSRGRGWVYFDTTSGTGGYCSPYTLVTGTRADGAYSIGTPEQSNRVVVYDSNFNIIPDTEYILDYVDCRVVTSGSCSPAYIDYYWNYVGVVDEWEGLVSMEPPVVVVVVKPYKKGPYQLGGGKEVTRRADLHIFASSMAERNDLVEVLYDGLYNKSIPIYDFPIGSVLDYDGTWYGRKDNANKLTSLFDRGVISNTIGNMWFENISSRTIEIGASLDVATINTSDDIFLNKMNKYRARITFDIKYYTKW